MTADELIQAIRDADFIAAEIASLQVAAANERASQAAHGPPTQALAPVRNR